MNRIVREHYPVADLPEDLRSGLAGDHYVRVTLEQERRHPAAVATKRAGLAQLYERARPGFNGLDEIAAHIGNLRRERD